MQKNDTAGPRKSFPLGQLTGVGDILAVLGLSRREERLCRNGTATFFQLAKLRVWRHCLSNGGSRDLPLTHANLCMRFFSKLACIPKDIRETSASKRSWSVLKKIKQSNKLQALVILAFPESKFAIKALGPLQFKARSRTSAWWKWCTSCDFWDLMTLYFVRMHFSVHTSLAFQADFQFWDSYRQPRSKDLGEMPPSLSRHASRGSAAPRKKGGWGGGNKSCNTWKQKMNEYKLFPASIFTALHVKTAGQQHYPNLPYKGSCCQEEPTLSKANRKKISGGGGKRRGCPFLFSNHCFEPYSFL